MNGILTRLELDVMQANELHESVELAHKYRFPAIIVHPGLCGDAIRTRARSQGRFKIITPVDWPKGENSGTTKFRGLDSDAIDTDGFEICLTGHSEGETRNEARALTNFIKTHLGTLVEVRFIIAAYTHDLATTTAICRGLQGIPTPAFIRTDTQLKLQVNRANTDTHNALITTIRESIRAPIKISGNIASVRAITGVPDAGRFAVNLAQAKAIIKEYTQQPDELHTILNKPLTNPDGDG